MPPDEEAQGAHSLGAARRLSERDYQLLLESTSDVVLWVNLDGVIEWVSPSVRGVLGLAQDAWVGTRHIDIVHPDFRATFADDVMRSIDSGDEVVFEYPVVNATGELMWLDSVERLAVDAVGEPLCRVVRLRDISERRALLSQVQESEEMFRAAMMGASVGMALAAANGSFLSVNAALSEFFGRDEDDLLQRTWQELTHPDDVESDQALAGQILDGARDSYRLTKRYLRPDGGVVWGDLSVSAARDTEGRLRFFIAQIIDITQVVRARELSDAAQRDLAAQRTYLRAVMDSELDARVRLDPVRDETGQIVDFIYMDANAAALRYFRRPLSQLVGGRMLELFPGQGRSGMFRRYVEAVESGASLILDDVPLTSEVSGHTRHFDFRGVVVDGFLSVSWRDVTADYEREVALKESEQHFRLLAENATDVVLLARDNVMQWLSPSLTRALGWTPEQWVGHTFEEFTHPDDVASTQKGSADVASGRSGILRLRVRSAANEYHWVEAHAAPFTDANGDASGMMASFRVVDEQVDAEAKLVHQAFHDPLTGLSNREHIFGQLEAMLSHEPRSGTRTQLAFIDLDNLKDINDDYGHAAGDELLRIVGERVYDLGCTVGAFILFPLQAHAEGKWHWSINQARGTNARIRDRFDLTLECIRRHYQGDDHPLAENLRWYNDFFDLFGDFTGYVDFFLLNDLVSDDGQSVRFLADFDDFQGEALPIGSVDEYRDYLRRTMEFVNARNARIERWAN